MAKKKTTDVKQSSDNSATERKRYSDEELMEFKDIILKKLEKARNDLKMLTDAFTGQNDNDTLDTSPTFKVLEEGYSVLSKEENSHLAARQQKFIKSLEMALVRIENKTYGICRATGKLISKERLRAVPHATLSIEAKLNQQPAPKFTPISTDTINEEKENL
jgi:DnaK suppressor protein